VPMRSRPITVALALLGVVAAGCANEPNVGGSGGIDHATGPNDVVFRLSYEGGFVPLEYTLTQFPAFTLYGDGRIVTPGAQIAIYPGPALPAVSQRAVTEEGMQAILQAALDAGLGRGDRDHSDFGSTLIADASTAVFTLSADGRTSRVSVYALAELPEQPDGMSDAEFAARQALSDLANRLVALDQWLPQGSIGPEEPFRTGAYRLFVGRYRPDEQLPQDSATWPLATALPTPDTGGTGYACLVVRGDDWDQVAPLAEGANQLTPWSSGGAEYSVLFRPLLPEESGC
jgi:hypothetical protein